jgi:hypothetical protein
MILNYNNQIAKLKTKLEERQQQSAKWQAELDQVMKNASQKSLQLGQVKMYNYLTKGYKQSISNCQKSSQ